MSSIIKPLITFLHSLKNNIPGDSVMAHVLALVALHNNTSLHALIMSAAKMILCR
ncbi:hypothetical protein CDL12_18949 [Handroanthus impetiginosus]|uniref:Uncharacterized protein n=1 Tax=Handroanthus impetiginosus TaxID=429701 RepID=A0A2G9GTD3_9LAMI|nr:hypothetical protein CDL12_18949 [Handroanthus impetiginosus]